VAVGHSAGGHLALWGGEPRQAAGGQSVAHRRSAGDRRGRQPGGDRRPEGAGQGPSGCPAGEHTIDRLIDAAGREAPFADTSPAELLPAGAKVVMVHGVFDSVMPPYTGRDYAAKVAQGR